MNISQADQLAGYLQKATGDVRMNTSQLSLYTAILNCWQSQNCAKQFKISRKELMALSKIASSSTYHICIKALVKLGYIVYEPTYNSYSATRMTLIECHSPIVAGQYRKKEKFEIFQLILKGI